MAMSGRYSALANKIVELALAGDLRAAELIVERIDATVPQGIVGDDEHDPVRMEVGFADFVRLLDDVARAKAGRADEPVPLDQPSSPMGVGGKRPDAGQSKGFGRG